jgi:rubredoxin
MEIGRLILIGKTIDEEEQSEGIFDCSNCKHRFRERSTPYRKIEANAPCPDCNNEAYKEFLREQEELGTI